MSKSVGLRPVQANCARKKDKNFNWFSCIERTLRKHKARREFIKKELARAGLELFTGEGDSDNSLKTLIRVDRVVK